MFLVSVACVTQVSPVLSSLHFAHYTVAVTEAIHFDVHLLQHTNEEVRHQFVVPAIMNPSVAVLFFLSPMRINIETKL
jgi:NADH:ubiquinone oxidoreductase subunit 6 (subunit J)